MDLPPLSLELSLPQQASLRQFELEIEATEDIQLLKEMCFSLFRQKLMKDNAFNSLLKGRRNDL